jgi:hypothetical protein
MPRQKSAQPVDIKTEEKPDRKATLYDAIAGVFPSFSLPKVKETDIARPNNDASLRSGKEPSRSAHLANPYR